MSTQYFLELCTLISLSIMIISFLMILFHLIISPTLPDKVLALDMLVTIGIGFIAVITVRTGHFAYLDVAISLGLIGFLATVAFARYIMNRGISQEDNEIEQKMEKSDI